MTFSFGDMVQAVEDYPVANVQLEIIDVDIPGNALNEGEVANFRVKVTNTGPLNLTGVTLRIRGRNGATVANNNILAPFVPDFVTQVMPDINGHGGSQLTVGSPLKFKAPGGAQASKTLVEASLEAHDFNLNHILNGHSDPLNPPNGTFAAEVVPL